MWILYTLIAGYWCQSYFYWVNYYLPGINQYYYVSNNWEIIPETSFDLPFFFIQLSST